MSTDSIFEVYCSPWTFGFGRFIAIVTSQYDENGKDITSEVFLFAPDTEENIFKGRIINYKYHEGDEAYGNFDVEFMSKEAFNQAQCMIQLCQSEHYKSKHDPQIFTGQTDLTNCERSSLVILRENENCLKHINDIAKDTRSEQLKTYINLFLQKQRIEIRTYNQ